MASDKVTVALRRPRDQFLAVVRSTNFFFLSGTATTLVLEHILAGYLYILDFACTYSSTLALLLTVRPRHDARLDINNLILVCFVV